MKIPMGCGPIFQSLQEYRILNLEALHMLSNRSGLREIYLNGSRKLFEERVPLRLKPHIHPLASSRLALNRPIATIQLPVQGGG